MKKIIFLIPFVFICFATNAQMVISTDGSDNEPSAILLVNSTDKGFLPPVMPQSKRDIIASPVESLFLYQNDNTKGYYYYDGSSWKNFTGSADNLWSVTGNSGTVDGTNFIGNTDNVALTFRVNNIFAGRIDQSRRNSFIGFRTGQNSTSGFATTSNSAIGFKALSDETGYSSCIALGASSLALAHSQNNIAIGAGALFNDETAGHNLAVGYHAMYNNSYAQANIAIGVRAMLGLTYTNHENAWDTYNIAVGVASMYYVNPYDDVDQGVSNVAIGDSSMFGFSTAIRHDATANTVLGYKAMYSVHYADSNSAAGYEALYSITTGEQNVALGYHALYNITEGEGNTSAGWSAGSIINGTTTGDYNTSLGYSSTPENETRTNTVNIRGYGYGDVHIDGDNQAAFGDWDMSSIGGQVSWTTISDKRVKKNFNENVPGLDFIKKLNPVTYQFKKGKIYVNDKPVFRKNREIVHTGLLAQDVEKAAQSMNFDFDGIDKPENPENRWGLRYALFTVPLIKAVQENQQVIEETQQSIESAEKSVEKLDRLEQELEEIKRLINQR